MNKICVYTCITGNYDNLKDIKYKEKSIDYICFTNNKNISSKDYKMIYIEEDLDNLTLARKVKILGYKYLSNYDITIWMDGAIEIVNPILKFIDEQCELDKYDMVGFKHQLRDCIYDEINECVRVGKENIENAKKLERLLIESKYPKHNGLIESSVLVRKNIPSVNDLMDHWFNMLSKYSRRDQLSFNYVLWKYPIKIKLLDIWVFNNPYFLHDQHSGKPKQKKYRLYCGNATNFDYHKCIDGIYTDDELKKGLKIKLPISTGRLELTIDEIGNCIKSVSLNKKNEMFIYNTCEINSKKYFYDYSVISFDGEFKKNDELIFKIDIENNNEDLQKLIAEAEIELFNNNKALLNEKKELNNIINEKNNELNSIYNSKSWKITKPLRILLKIIKKKQINHPDINKFDYYKKQIRMNKYFYSILMGKKYMVMKYYKKYHGYSYNFNNPVTFTEKINSRKLDNNPLIKKCANKISIREYVEKKIGKEYLIPLIFVADKLTPELYDSMPNSCVLKTASGSGTIHVIFDKSKENKDDILNLMKEYQKIKFEYIWGEMFYKCRKNPILCEKLLTDKNGKVPADYKIHCFKNGGDKKCILQIDFDRFDNHTRNLYDEDFNLLDLRTGLENYSGTVKKPKNYKEMFDVAKKLSEDFDYVRVDLYNLDGKIYFGELTFTHNAGFTKFDPEECDKLWGSYWK